MSVHRSLPRGLPTLLALTIVLLTAPSCRGQPPATPPNPAAPTLAMPAPMGIQRGTRLTLTLTGFLVWSRSLKPPTSM